MSHLVKAVEILKRKYASEIYADGDWSYNLRNWTVKISTEDDVNYQVVAYRANGDTTNWADYIVLNSYPVQFELT